MLMAFSLMFSVSAFSVVDIDKELDLVDEYLVELNKEDNYKTADDEVTLSYVKRMDALLRNDVDKTDEQHSEIYLMKSGLFGIYAKKNNSIKKGRESFENLQLAVDVAPKYYRAVHCYASTVIGLSDQGRIRRFLIQKTLKIKLKVERSEAISLLQQFDEDDARELIIEISEF